MSHGSKSPRRENTDGARPGYPFPQPPPTRFPRSVGDAGELEPPSNAFRKRKSRDEGGSLHTPPVLLTANGGALMAGSDETRQRRNQAYLLKSGKTARLAGLEIGRHLLCTRGGWPPSRCCRLGGDDDVVAVARSFSRRNPC